MSQQQGKFIVIEGLEGAGKSSAIALVNDIIQRHIGQAPVCTRKQSVCLFMLPDHS